MVPCALSRQSIPFYLFRRKIKKHTDNKLNRKGETSIAVCWERYCACVRARERGLPFNPLIDRKSAHFCVNSRTLCDPFRPIVTHILYFARYNKYNMPCPCTINLDTQEEPERDILLCSGLPWVHTTWCCYLYLFPICNALCDPGRDGTVQQEDHFRVPRTRTSWGEQKSRKMVQAQTGERNAGIRMIGCVRQTSVYRMPLLNEERKMLKT